MSTAQSLELLPIDIRRFREGNTGIPYVTTLDSETPGPHVLIMALTHGNEVCGAHALSWLVDEGLQPRRGKLTLAFGNVDAYDAFDPANPTASRFIDEDMNRVWGNDILDGPRQSRELARARELRPVVAQADFLLDIHSMQTNCPPLMLCGTHSKGRELAARLGVPPLVVSDAGHRAGPRMRDYLGFGDEASSKTALLVECGQHWKSTSREMAIQTALHFLRVIDTVDRAWLAPRLGAQSAAQRFVRVTEAVTITTAKFRFLDDFEGMEVIARAGTAIAMDGELPVLTPYDDCTLVMPSRRQVVGQTAVRFGRFES